MSRLDDIERRIDERMAEIDRRIGKVMGDENKTVPPIAFTTPACTLSSVQAVPVVSEKMDTSSAPGTSITMLTEKDLDSVSQMVEFHLAGLKPGGNLLQKHDNQQTRAIVEEAKKIGLTLGHCCVMNGKNKVDDIAFGDDGYVFCRGIPERSADDACLVQRFVAMTAAYYHRRWNFDGINHVTTLWSYAEAFCGDNTLPITFSANGNAYSDYKYGGSTNLCFSPNHASQNTAGHEFTHSVSQNRVGWTAYLGETGAIDESFSDIFAKFSTWAWTGRDEGPSRWIYSNIRNMAHPEISPEGDMVGWIPASYYKQPPNKDNPRSGWYVGTGDHCGVHINNGVITRLCFLLCEGEDFTRDDELRFDVQPIGFERTEQLFGQLMFGPCRYLPRNCNMYSFYEGITRAAEDLNFSQEERNRLMTACEAVNIKPQQSILQSRSEVSMERKLMSVRSNVPGGTAMHYTKALACEFSSELGLNVSGADIRVVEEAVTKPADIHAAVPTGGEVQVVMEQTWNGLPVFGSSVIARVRDGDTVTYLQNRFSNALGSLQTGVSISAEEAGKMAIGDGHGQSVSSASKIVFDPSLLGLGGNVCVAWLVLTESDGEPEEQCIVDACSGRVIFSSPLRIVD